MRIIKIFVSVLYGGHTVGSFYIDDEKIIDMTLTELIIKIGDDGGAFTGGYDRRR